MLTHGSLFAGIGGFDLGFARAGIKTLWAVEIEPYCQAVLRKNFPDTEILSDVKEVGKHNLRTVNIVSAGFPCQPYSLAGKRAGQADDRDLWPEVPRIVSEIEPDWVVCENVPGIDSLALEQVLSDLEAIGYETAPPLEIPAAAVEGGHERQRVWIVAHNEKNGRQRSVRGNFKNRQKASWKYKPGQSSGSLDSRLFIFEEFEKRVGQPAVLRVDDGIPNRVDRLAVCGNAAHPGITQILGRIITELDHITKREVA